MKDNFYGIHLRSRFARAIDWVIVRDNYVADFPVGLLIDAAVPHTHIRDLIASGNIFESIGRPMTAAMSFEAGVVQQVECMGNTTRNVAIAFGTYPDVPILTGGSRGAGGIYSCAGGPNGQIREQVGAMVRLDDGGWVASARVVGFPRDSTPLP